jgi:glutathione S-transferase
MLIVHHLETSRSQRVLWLLEELGVPYELKVYQRDKATRLAPPELKEIHPLGKSPVISDDGEVIAESGAIIEYLAEEYGRQAPPELAGLQPAPGSPAARQCRFWMHYAEGSLMNWLMMKLVFTTLPRQPMPFFARPIARTMCGKVATQLIDPNLRTACSFIDEHLGRNRWFSGPELSMADFQMSFPVEAMVARSAEAANCRHLIDYRERMRSRPAYQRAEAKGGPTLMAP